MRALKPASIIAALWVSHPAFAADLTVEINGVETAKGQVVICLWANENGFPICPKDATGRQVAEAVNGALITFEGIDPGLYAISAFHDKDGNGKLKQNFIGIPKEPAAVSGPKQKRMGPPKFKGALIEVGEDGAQVTLTFE